MAAAKSIADFAYAARRRKSVGEVARAVGYDSSAAFSTAFKQVASVSRRRATGPTEFNSLNATFAQKCNCHCGLRNNHARIFVTRKFCDGNSSLLAFAQRSWRSQRCNSKAVSSAIRWLESVMAAYSTRTIFAARRLLHREQAEQVEAAWTIS